MDSKPNLISDAFRVFMTDAPNHAKAWSQLGQALSLACALDKKTYELAHLAVLAALNRVSGIPFHVVSARQLGASRDEVISALLVGLPLAGQVVTQALPAAIQAYDSG